MKCGHKRGYLFIYYYCIIIIFITTRYHYNGIIVTSVNTGAIAPVCTHFLNYINNWWYCNVINL